MRMLSILLLLTLLQGCSKGNYFPATEGDTWVYATTTSQGLSGEVTARIESVKTNDSGETDIIMSMDKPPLKIHYSRSGDAVYMHSVTMEASGDVVKYHGPKRELSANVQDGTQWTYEGEVAGSKIREEFYVSDAQTVTVPAGTFEAIRVEATSAQGQTMTEKTIWYAPNVGMIKRIDRANGVRSGTDLVKYTPAGG